MIVYITTNLLNNKKYIGKDERNNPKYLGSGKILLKAIKKRGIDNFKKEILEVCENRQHLIEREIYWIKYYNATKSNNFYNILLGGEGGHVLDGKSNKEILKWKQKISNSTKGYKNGMYSKTHSEEVKKKISENNKSLLHGNNNRLGNKNPFFNKSHSSQTLEKMSKASKGGNNGRAKKVEIEGVIYDCAKDASIKLNINYSTVLQRLSNKNRLDYKFM